MLIMMFALKEVIGHQDCFEDNVSLWPEKQKLGKVAV